MATGQLNITHVTVGQSNKEVTINDAFDILDNAQNRVLSKAITGDVTLTNTEFLEYGLLELTGTPGSGFVVRVPNIARRWAVLNTTDAAATIEVLDAGTDAAVIGIGTLALMHTDGADVYTVSGGGSGGSSSAPGQSQSTTTTSRDLTDADLDGNNVVFLNSASAATIFVPSGLTGTEPVTFIQINNGKWTFDEQSGVSIIAKAGATRTTGVGAAVTLLPDLGTADTYYLFGDLETI